MNYKLLSVIYTVVFSLVLSSCASLSKDECLTADWQIIGYEDGIQGSSAARIGEHREACAKHGVTPNKSAYDLGYDEGVRSYCSLSLGIRSGQSGNSLLGVCPQDTDYHIGYQEGLENYCTYESGYQQGLRGASYRNVCPSHSEANFLDGFDAGKHIFTLESSLRTLANNLEGIIEDQDKNERNIENTKSRITYEENLTSEQRRRLLEQLEDYNERTVELESSHIAIEVEMEQIRRELNSLNR